MEGQDETRRLAAISSAGVSDEDPTWVRLKDQLDWYDRKSLTVRRAYKRTKVIQLVLAAAVLVAVSCFHPA